jgi:hypothetical protein
MIYTRADASMGRVALRNYPGRVEINPAFDGAFVTLKRGGK